MYIPGYVENWNVIIETKSQSLWTLRNYYDVKIIDIFNNFHFIAN